MAVLAEDNTPTTTGVCGRSPNCGNAGGLFPACVTIREKDPARFSERYEWVVVDNSVTWRGELDGKNIRVTVPEGFETDLASVPRCLTWLIPRYGQYTRAAVVHDFLCQNAIGSAPQVCASCVAGVVPIELQDRSDADTALRTMMKTVGVPWARRWLMWSAVSWATVFTALRATLKGPKSDELRRTWRRDFRPLILLIVVATLVAVGDVFVTQSTWSFPLRLAVIALGSFVILAEAIMIAGCMALRRWRDRLLLYSWAAVFTALSLGLLVTGALVGLVLVIYLLIEDFPRFRGVRAYFGGSGASAARQRRLEAASATVAARQSVTTVAPDV